MDTRTKISRYTKLLQKAILNTEKQNRALDENHPEMMEYRKSRLMALITGKNPDDVPKPNSYKNLEVAYEEDQAKKIKFDPAIMEYLEIKGGHNDDECQRKCNFICEYDREMYNVAYLISHPLGMKD